ncbi:hypothetical protein [Neobacillus driksii]|jgi:hypothetical protein
MNGKKPEGFIIHYLKMKYTNEMEKGLLSAHGVCYEVYKRKLDVRMEVEKRRELDHLLCKQLYAHFDGKLHG